MFLMWFLELFHLTYPNIVVTRFEETIDKHTWKFMVELLMYDTNFGDNLIKWEQLKMEET